MLLSLQHKEHKVSELTAAIQHGSGKKDHSKLELIYQDDQFYAQNIKEVHSSLSNSSGFSRE